MSMQTVREFINRHQAYAAGLAGLGAALDAKASGAPLDPALDARIQDLLAAIGAGNILADLTAEEAMSLVSDLRVQLLCTTKLLYPETRTTSWSFSDAQLLQEVGEFARGHAHGITRGVVPALEGMAQRFAAPGAAFLDIGVGVAGTSIALAQQWPGLRVVGIDVFQPALALARENVDRANLRERIELREQRAESLEDESAFDLVWVPIFFVPEAVIPAVAERTLRALRPGGWVMFVYPELEGMDAARTAFWRLRVTTWGGPLWSSGEVEKLLREKGFADVHALPRPPGGPTGIIVGRRGPG
jgi:SAM-dependent methyltransferase